MLSERSVVEKLLCEKFLLLDAKRKQEKYIDLNNQFNIPVSYASDIVEMRTDLSEVSDFILYCFVDNFLKSNIHKVFSKEEIETYSKKKYVSTKLKLPYTFENVTKITDTQFVTKTTVKEMVLLRDCQFINYNKNAQRTMSKKIIGNKEYYRISINRAAIDAIKKSLKEHIFVPNTITLNIPNEKWDASFIYSDGKFVIKELSSFDILDGYHRYIAMCELYDEDNTFDYPMELRIVSFTETKAQQFIFQEDQKTKMRKIDSNSFNMRLHGNVIANRLNDDTNCLLYGLIGRNGGVVNAGELGILIQYFYFNNKTNIENAYVLSVTKELKEKFNSYIEENMEIIDGHIDLWKLICIIYGFKENKEVKLLIDAAEKLSPQDKHKMFSLSRSKYPARSGINFLKKVGE